MAYFVIYHPDVLASDLPRIGRSMQIRIKRAVENRLLAAPESYGEPLSGNLAGYWKLRTGDYRIVFKARENEIRVYAILHRDGVYDEILKRIPR